MLATQPVEAPGAGPSTQPAEALGAGPEALLTGTGNAALHAEQTSTGGKTVDITGGSDSDGDLQSEPGSPVVTTSGTVPQTETSPEMTQLIRNSLRRLVIEKPSEG